jgi:hypothetical protein
LLADGIVTAKEKKVDQNKMNKISRLVRSIYFSAGSPVSGTLSASFNDAGFGARLCYE